jgi:hypothetical protein
MRAAMFWIVVLIVILLIGAGKSEAQSTPASSIDSQKYAAFIARAKARCDQLRSKKSGICVLEDFVPAALLARIRKRIDELNTSERGAGDAFLESEGANQRVFNLAQNAGSYPRVASKQIICMQSRPDRAREEYREIQLA